jgi:phosphoglycolate phosphatase
MPITIATFDLDNTLVRRRTQVANSLKMRAINRSIETVFSLKNVDYFSVMGPELYGMTDRSIMRRVLGILGIAPPEIDSKLNNLFEVMIDYFNAELKADEHDDYVPLPGAIELLKQMKAQNIACGLATGNYSQFANWKLNTTGMAGLFSFGGYGEDADERWQIVKIALDRSGAKDSFKACHFGDTPADIKAAAINGMLSVAITAAGGGKFSKNELIAAGADLVLDSYYNIDDVFKLFEV